MRISPVHATLAALVLTLALFLAGCGEPTPEPDGEPQAPAPAEPTALRAAIEEPLDKAKAVEDTQAAAEAERERMLAETGG
ncbi:hypothetical protein [Arenimonas composti]|uniref:Uncharacterized protein n=1 Tax=Arenimonas composti TR7-09 = DSM 18010 TaxID=1121013 RepID=A0A091BDR7_9GAMM|nr:hypothetical protein [Arenimonas composti]KFN49881.1 hypothetical protein P873_08540 [Arenimonas composti TR7-09 = DSM 18010]